MLAVGLGIVWGGYLLTCYGFGITNHKGLSLLDWAVPGYYAKNGPNGPGVINVPDLTPAQQNAPGGRVINPATGLTAPPPGWHYDPVHNIMVGP